MKPGPRAEETAVCRRVRKNYRFSEPDVLGPLHLKPSLGVLGLIQFNKTPKLSYEYAMNNREEIDGFLCSIELGRFETSRILKLQHQQKNANWRACEISRRKR
jgi:hypothetical protein